ncbi:unnamed protein product, partial [Prorocentrum cordatum]
RGGHPRVLLPVWHGWRLLREAAEGVHGHAGRPEPPAGELLGGHRPRQFLPRRRESGAFHRWVHWHSLAVDLQQRVRWPNRCRRHQVRRQHLEEFRKHAGHHLDELRARRFPGRLAGPWLTARRLAGGHRGADVLGRVLARGPRRLRLTPRGGGPGHGVAEGAGGQDRRHAHGHAL